MFFEKLTEGNLQRLGVDLPWATAEESCSLGLGKAFLFDLFIATKARKIKITIKQAYLPIY